jgi:SHS2 domain-containing protein
MPFEFLEDVAIADIAFAAWGATIEDALRAAADATMNVMVEDLDSIAPLHQRAVMVESPTLEMLLFDLLQEQIYLKDAEVLLTRVATIAVHATEAGFHLEAVLSGEPIDNKRHRLRVDVKAVTLYRLRFGRTDRGWEAHVTLDI